MDVLPAAVVEIANGHIHSLVGIPANTAGERSFYMVESATRLIQIQIIRPVIAGAVDISPPILVEIRRSQGYCPVGLWHPQCRDIFALKNPG